MKRFVSCVLAFALTFSFIPAGFAVETGRTAYPSTQNVEVDGRTVEFQCYALKDAAGNDTNYIKLRDLANVLNGSGAQFEVGWNGAVNIETGKEYTPNGSEMTTPFSGTRAYEPAAAATNINGAAADLDAIVLKDDAGNGYTYYKLRDLGKALGIIVDWTAERGIYIETGKKNEAPVASENQMVTMYALDGRTNVVPKDMVEANKAVGWYEKPVTILYAADGRTRVTWLDEVDAYLKVGWYKERPNIAPVEIKVEILKYYGAEIEKLEAGVDLMMNGIDSLSKGDYSASFTLSYLAQSYRYEQEYIKLAIEDLNTAINLCGEYADTQKMKGYLKQRADQLSLITNYNITENNVLDYMKYRNNLCSQTEWEDAIIAESELWGKNAIRNQYK